MEFIFEWDENKAAINKRKHDVTFDEAQTIFTDKLSIMKPDTTHVDDEERLLIIGMSNKNRLVVVSYTERGERIRLINARKATRDERKQYEEDAI
jgi:uncharacterized DUF497 family protein